MPNIYARDSALSNVLGRSNYINNEKRQEHIELKINSKMYSWSDYISFEKKNKKSTNKNIEARETVIALPNELSKNKDELKNVCDSLGNNLYGNNRDYEYAVHWNKSKSNLHVHFIYTERERINDIQPKIYKKNLWIDSETGRACKEDNPNALLRCKKGDIQKDKNGNIKYNIEPFTAKDPKYKNKNWLKERNKIIQKTLSDFGYNLDIQDEETPFLSQRKIYKGASDEYTKAVREYNIQTRQYNENVKAHLEIDPSQKSIYQEIRKTLEKDVLEESRKNNNKFTKKASKIVLDMKNFVIELVQNLQGKIIGIMEYKGITEWWNTNKELIKNTLEETQEMEQYNAKTQQDLPQLKQQIEYQENEVFELEKSLKDDFEIEIGGMEL